MFTFAYSRYYLTVGFTSTTTVPTTAVKKAETSTEGENRLADRVYCCRHFSECNGRYRGMLSIGALAQAFDVGSVGIGGSTQHDFEARRQRVEHEPQHTWPAPTRS